MRLPQLPVPPHSAPPTFPLPPGVPPHPKLTAAEVTKLGTAELSLVEAVLQSEFEGSLFAGAVLAIRTPFSMRGMFGGDARTQLLYELMYRGAALDSALAEAVHDFCDRNASESEVKELGTIRLRHTIVAEESLDRTFHAGRGSGDAWRRFYERYPKSDSLICLSRPGFDRKLTVALIYLAIEGQSFSYGRIHVLRKREGNWTSSDETIGPSWIAEDLLFQSVGSNRRPPA